ncbi:lamin tail domain-containing protein [bacterium]|nr:lamin tail domain-containing protein [bacterium]
MRTGSIIYRLLAIPAVCFMVAIGHSYGTEISSDARWTLSDSPVSVAEAVTIRPGATLTIDAGVMVMLAEDAAILVEGSLLANGTANEPIVFTRATGSNAWPGIEFSGARVWNTFSSRSVFEFCRFEHISNEVALQAWEVDLEFSNCVFETIADTVIRCHDGKIRLTDSLFRDCGEGVNAVRCNANISRNRFYHIRNGADAIDVDLEYSGEGLKPANIAQNIIEYCSGDGIDLGSSAARISGNLIRRCADKGISLGEGSNARVENNVVLHCAIGIAVKDRSAPVMANNTVASCTVGVSVYEKEIGMGGARGHWVNGIVWNCDESIRMDLLSFLDVRYSLIGGPVVWPGEGNTNADPQFGDLNADNVLLQPGSPALNAGTSRLAPAADYHGVARSATPTPGAFDDAATGYDSDGDGQADVTDALPFNSLNVADPPAESSVVINEIMYRPANDAVALEYIELFNRGDSPVDLSDWQLVDETLFDFPDGTTILPGSFLVVAANPGSIEAAYGLSGVLGPWSGDLGDEYAVVRLVDGNQGDADTVEYRNADGWPLGADGSGSSLELIDTHSDNNVGSHWAESVDRDGTPGRKNGVAEGSIVINEFLALSHLGTADWIELYNRGDTQRDISGWYLTDNAETLTEWTIPADTVLQPGEAVFFDSLNFGLSAEGEELFLTRSDGITVESRVAFGDQQADVTQGRHPDGSPSWSFYPANGTPGQPNGPPTTAAVIINEIMYHPAGDNDAEEFIELYNAGPGEVDLTGWKIRGGIRFDFPMDETLAAGAYLVVAHDPDSVNAKYDLDDSLGPFDSRRLSNRGENLSLRDALGNVVDAVFYRDRGRWPRAADGEGASLELRSPTMDNALPEAWTAASVASEGTPGTANGSGTNAAAIIFSAGHYPVTPTSAEAVTIRARVSNGGRPVHLRWKKDGDTVFQSITMTPVSGADLVAEIPPQSNRDLIEYYIEAEDAAGNVATWPPGAPVFHLASGGQVPFTLRYLCLDSPAPNGVPSFRLLVPRETLDKLQARELSSDELLPITMTYGDEVFPFARYRYRGTLKREWSVKSYRIDLEHDHPFAGEDRLNFNGKRPGPEWLATEYVKEAGFAVPELQAICLHINHRDQGPYLWAERIGGDYLERNYRGASTGTFYESWGEGDTGIVPPEILEVLDVVRNTNQVDYVTAVRQVIDPDQWLSWATSMALLGNNETILGGISGNHAVYLHPDSGLLRLEPLDLDATWEPASLGMPVHVATPLPRPEWPAGLEALEALMRTPYFQRRYYQILADELDEWFLPSRLTDVINDHFHLIDPGGLSAPDQGSPATTSGYLNLRRNIVEQQISDLVSATASFAPKSITSEIGGIYWQPFPEVELSGVVVPDTHRVLVNQSTAGVTLNSSNGTWSYSTTLSSGDTVLSLAAQPLSNRAYQTPEQILTLRYDGNDDDGDGLPNSWEIYYGLDPNDDGSLDSDQGAAGDPDGDGITNLEEYEARSHPTLSLPPRLSVAALSPDGIRLTWLSAPGAIYQVQFSDSLTGTWTNVGLPLAGTGTNLSATFSTLPAQRRFFRVALKNDF